MTTTPRSYIDTKAILDAISRAPLPSDKLVFDKIEIDDYKEYYNQLIDKVANEQAKVLLSNRLVKKLSKEQLTKILDNVEYVVNFLETIENGN